MKFKRGRKRSIRSGLMLLVGSLAAVCMAALVVYSVYAMQVTKRQASELNRNTIILQSDIVDTLLSYGNQYLLYLSTMTDDIETVGRAESTSIEYHLASWRILQQFQKGYQQYGDIDGTFLYLPERDVYLTSASGVEYDRRYSAREQIILCLNGRDFEYSRYFALKMQGGYIVVKALPVSNGYIGIWYTTDTLLAALQTSQIARIDYIALATRENLVLDNDPLFAQPLQSEFHGSEECVALGGRNYLVSRCGLQNGDFSLLALVDEGRVLENFRYFYLFICLLVVFFISTVAITSLVCRSILSPLEELMGVMHRIRGGDWEVDFEEEETYEEIQVFSNTFSLMMREIKRLKMDVYEEKLQWQKVMRQYYQIQIQPHFFMNSINMIYQLAQSGNYELVQQMALHLGGYFRYSLQNKEEQIALRDEFSFIQEYLEIQKIRYPYHLEVSVSIDPQAEEMQLPPLAIQTFVENAVKYSITMDTVTEISLTALREDRDGEGRLSVTVADNGPGFPEHVLEALREGRRVTEDGRKCMGIYNVQQRLQLIYGGKGSVEFRNRYPHGAEVEISVPSDS